MQAGPGSLIAKTPITKPKQTLPSFTPVAGSLPASPQVNLRGGKSSFSAPAPDSSAEKATDAAAKDYTYIGYGSDQAASMPGAAQVGFDASV